MAQLCGRKQCLLVCHTVQYKYMYVCPYMYTYSRPYITLKAKRRKGRDGKQYWGDQSPKQRSLFFLPSLSSFPTVSLFLVITFSVSENCIQQRRKQKGTMRVRCKGLFVLCNEWPLYLISRTLEMHSKRLLFRW